MQINQRHSIRQFTDKPVEKKMITKIVELAQRAPSWVNLSTLASILCDGGYITRN